MKTLVYTVLALFAFAANSVLCRYALGAGTIDAASFTVVRLLSGVFALQLILWVRPSESGEAAQGSWISAAMLFLYAITFSFAYISLTTGTGALVLFSAVQLTIIFANLFSGGRMRALEWLGASLAFAGLVYLVWPQVATPSVQGFVLMAVAGMAWGIYTLRGRGTNYPLRNTAANFLRTAPFFGMLAIVILALNQWTVTLTGLSLAIASGAVASGAVASGIGYAIWYRALRGLSATESAVVQLSVPVIAALGGLLFVGEPLTLRLVLASAVILGGILVVILSRASASWRSQI